MITLNMSFFFVLHLYHQTVKKYLVFQKLFQWDIINYFIWAVSTLRQLFIRGS